MKIEIEFTCGEYSPYSPKETDATIEYVLMTAVHKIRRQRQRDPGCVCTAPEADDILKDINGNDIGTVRVTL